MASPFGPDPWAPAQWVFGSAGAAGPSRSPNTDFPIMNPSDQTTFDNTLHWKLGGTVIMALLLVFVLQRLGFRFVVGAGVGK